jgi:hypothetical protein
MDNNPTNVRFIYVILFDSLEISDSENLAKLLRLNEFSEAYLPSREYEEMRTLTRHRKYLGEEIVRIKR